MSEVNNIQIAGTHYKTEYQTWDFIHDMGLGYFEGNIVKYVQRHAKKAQHIDLNKSKHYTQKTRELLATRNRVAHNLYSWVYVIENAGIKTHATENLDEHVRACLDRFRVANGIGTFEMEIIACVAKWQTIEDLEHIEFLIHALTRYAYPSTV